MCSDQTQSSERPGFLSSTALIVTVALNVFWVSSVPAQHAHKHAPLPNVMEYLHHLDDPERDQYQRPSQVVEALKLEPGMHVADLGSGSGYFTRRFVEAVTETGKVYAIDVEPQALKYVEDSLTGMQKPYSAEFILAAPDDSKLPISSVDLIFICNTYHHLENRLKYFRNLKSTLRPGGRITIIDFFDDDRSGELNFPKTHLVSREMVVNQLSAAGYKLIKEYTFLPKQYFLEFTAQK
ncbi:class I SAM-dependent methyltransferase [Petrachloros mirabilis]